MPALLGAVQDQDRLVLPLSASATSAEGGAASSGAAAPDGAAFTSLLQKASTTEENALG